jgi:hypothetical protein
MQQCYREVNLSVRLQKWRYGWIPCFSFVHWRRMVAMMMKTIPLTVLAIRLLLP